MLTRRKFITYAAATPFLLNLSESFSKEKTHKKKSKSTKTKANTQKVFPLQNDVNQLIQQKRKQGLIANNETTSWLVYDFKTKRKLVAINENVPMQAASMIKPFVATAYFYLYKQNPKKYPYNARTKKLIEEMIVYSDNSATNSLIKLCGGANNIKPLCQKSTKIKFKGLHFVESIPAGGKAYANKASANDYFRLLVSIREHKFYMANELERIMAINNRDRIQTDTNLPNNLKIYDKTGSTSMCCGDIGIVEFPDKKTAYIFIGIVNKAKPTTNYGEWMRNRGNVIRAVSELTYKQIAAHYKLVNSIG